MAARKKKTDTYDANLYPEQGIDPDELKGLPPGGGTVIVPPIQQFQSIYNPITRIYKSPDESILDSKLNSLAMRRSLVIMEPLRARQMATAELSFHIEGEDAKDKEQQQIAKGLTRLVEEIPDRLQLFMSLLEAVWLAAGPRKCVTDGISPPA